MRILVFLASLLLLTPAFASDYGLGFMIGQPIGVTGKKWLSEGQAIDAGAGWSIGRNPNFALHADYLWQKQDALVFDGGSPLDFYFGLGGRLNFDDEIEVGARVPLGLAFYMSDRQAELFAEIAPIMNLLPETNLEGDVLLGLRIFFF